MNVTVYLFGKLGGSYTQYPEDYSRDIFFDFENNIKSPTQIMIHRHDALVYYGYLRCLSEQGKYIGIAFVFNGVMCTDVQALCKLCEDSITNWIINGDILEFADNGDVISKVDKLYKTASEFKRLSETLSAQIISAKLPFAKLPPVNYAVSSNAVKTFNFDDGSESFNEAINEYSNIYIYSDSTSETLKGFSDKLHRLNKENIRLKEENAKVLRQKKRTTIVTILSIIVAVGLIAIIGFANRSSEQKRQINLLKTDNQHLNLHVKNLQRDSILLEQQLSDTRSLLWERTNHVNTLQKDSTRLTNQNRELSNDLAIANKNINAYRQTIEQKEKIIKERDKTISNLQTQLKNSQNNANAFPLTISSISIASTKKNGNIANDFGKYLYSSDSYYIKVKMYYTASTTGYRNLTIKLYGPSSYGMTWYDSETENVYLYSSSSYNFSKILGKNGTRLSKGDYKIEICYDGNIIKSQSFTLY